MSPPNAAYVARDLAHVVTAQEIELMVDVAREGIERATCA